MEEIINFSGMVKIEENTFCSRDILRMRMSCPEIGRRAMPGQFVMVKTAERQNLDPLLPRPFSVHWADSEGIEILYKVVGKGTGHMSGLKAGDSLSLYGPLGRGFTVEPVKSHILVGGGMGGAPLLYLAGFIRGNYPESDLRIIIGARCFEEIVEVDRFDDIGASSIQMATEDGSHGAKGLVTHLLKKLEIEGESPRVYSCGPVPMLKAVSGMCREKGWPCQVSMETVMACGMGACLGCAIEGNNGPDDKYLHVCSDGPVFDSSRLWSG